MLAEAKLNVLPIPKHTALVNVRYGSFDAALRDAQELVRFGAASIETLEFKVLALAQDDVIWNSVRSYFPEDNGEHRDRREPGRVRRRHGGGGRSAACPHDRRLDDPGQVRGRRGFTVAHGEADVNAIWDMRKKSVGLLGNMQGDKRPIAGSPK